MLHDLETLIGSHVHASDGKIGHIHTFLFDDYSWIVRYIVVDVGNLLGRREVILAIDAFEQPNWAAKDFHVRLTKKQVHDSPPADIHKPVSRQQELAMREYFGHLAFWVDHYLGASSLPAGAVYPVPAGEDPHLHSAFDIQGFQVWGNDGPLGTLKGFIVDEDSWHLGYLDIRAGEWLQDRAVLMPTCLVRCISWADHRLYLQRQKPC